MRKLAFLLSIIFLFGKSCVFGQVPKFEPAFKQGEIVQIPIAILQDSKGFIWIGTTDGVYRYDGKESLEFRHDPSDSTSISNNYVKELFEDRAGNIWMGTSFGLNCYDPKTETFTRYLRTDTDDLTGDNFIHSIEEDHRGKIWYGTYNGLFQFTPSTDSLIQFLPSIEKGEKSLSNEVIWDIHEDRQHRIWVATQLGFTLFKNDGTLDFQAYYGDMKNENGLATDRIFNILEQADSSIWLSSYDGLFRVIESNDSIYFKRFHIHSEAPANLSDNRVFDLYSGGRNRLWLGTYAGGLNEVVISPDVSKNIKVIHHKEDPKNVFSLRSNNIENILIDESGMLWIATKNGMDKASLSGNKFQTIRSIPDDSTSLSSDIIKSFFKDSFGNLWIGTFKGLNFLSAENLKKGIFQFEQFYADRNNRFSLSHNNINGIYEDSQSYLWINTFYGLNYIHIPTFLKKKKFKHFNERHGIPHTINHSTVEISPGEYWVGTNGGLAKMYCNPAKSDSVRFETIKSENEIVNTHTLNVIQDRFGNYWIGTFNGVAKYVTRQGKIFFENYIHELGNPNSLSDNSFRCFFKDRKNRIWIGTRSGLNMVVQESKESRDWFKTYGLKDGFPNDVIHAIEEDDQGQLWITTNKGIVVFNPELKDPVVATYNQNDGLAARSFVFRASMKDENGNLYFGTADGFNFFHPEKLPQNTYVPPVYFTKLKVLNEVIKPGPSSILQQSISYTNTITLQYWQNIISLEFAALDFNKPEKNRYQYRLSSLNNKNWINLKHHNQVTFTNLSPGEHLLEIKGSNNDGLWNKQPTQLLIKVLPPVWRTWWAYLFYFLVFISSIYLFVKNRIRRKTEKIQAIAQLEKARAEEREQLRKKNTADFHDELGHHFTKISLFLELAERQSAENKSLKEYLSKIKSNASGLSEGLRDLIWSLDPKKDSLYQTLARLQEFGDSLFEFSDIRFKTDGLDEALESVELAPDVKKNVLMIFKEAMNNCLKYSNAKNALLKSVIKDRHCYVVFKDDGQGFNPYEIKNGYGLKNMHSRAQKVKAQLEIKSVANQGTEVSLRL